MNHEDRGYSLQALKEFNNSGLKKTFQASAGTNGFDLVMYDVIGTDECNERTFKDALAQADGAPLTIRLSSPGGSVWSGWAIYNALKGYGGSSKVIVDGCCASIASVIALAADEVETQPTSMWMIHRASLLSYGNAADLLADAEALTKIDQNLAEIYAKKTGTDPAGWAEKMVKETWFTSAEAVEIGLADRLAEAPPRKDAAKSKAIATSRIDKAQIDETSKLVAMVALANLDPKGEATSDEACGLIQSAMILLQQACDTLSPPVEESDETEMALALAVRRKRAELALAI